MGGKSSEITAGVLELVDEEDSKSFGVTLVWVRVPPPHHRRRGLHRFAAIFYVGKQSRIAFAEDTLEL